MQRTSRNTILAATLAIGVAALPWSPAEVGNYALGPRERLFSCFTNSITVASPEWTQKEVDSFAAELVGYFGAYADRIPSGHLDLMEKSFLDGLKLVDCSPDRSNVQLLREYLKWGIESYLSRPPNSKIATKEVYASLNLMLDLAFANLPKPTFSIDGEIAAERERLRALLEGRAADPLFPGLKSLVPEKVVRSIIHETLKETEAIQTSVAESVVSLGNRSPTASVVMFDANQPDRVATLQEAVGRLKAFYLHVYTDAFAFKVSLYGQPFPARVQLALTQRADDFHKTREKDRTERKNALEDYHNRAHLEQLNQKAREME